MAIYRHSGVLKATVFSPSSSHKPALRSRRTQMITCCKLLTTTKIRKSPLVTKDYCRNHRLSSFKLRKIIFNFIIVVPLKRVPLSKPSSIIKLWYDIHDISFSQWPGFHTSPPRASSILASHFPPRSSPSYTRPPTHHPYKPKTPKTVVSYKSTPYPIKR
jgi:hypothetical protein